MTGNVVFHQLPGGEARALEKRPGFVGEDVNVFAGLDGGANDSEGGAVTCGGQGSGVAVGEDSAGLGQERGAVCSHGAIGGDVFGVDGERLFDERLLESREWFGR